MASIAAGEERMRASHIPIYHEGSRCEESWKDPEDQVISSTTRADAAVLLDELHDQILTDHASFADLAAQHSARPSAAGLRQRAECGQQHRNAVLISDGEISMIADCYHGISFVDLKLLRRHTKILM